MRAGNYLTQFGIFHYLRKAFRNIKHKAGSKQLLIGEGSALSGTRTGKHVSIGFDTRVNNCVINDYTYIASNCLVSHTDIGKFCSVGPGVICGPGVHPTTFISTHPAFYSAKPPGGVSFSGSQHFKETSRVKIGNDVWIGARAVILDGINIGDGAIIAAGAVVTRDIEPYAVAGGVPAKLIKSRFPNEKIEELLSLRWWDKDEKWLKENCHLFRNTEQFFTSVQQ